MKNITDEKAQHSICNMIELCKAYASGKDGMKIFSYEKGGISLFLASSFLLSGIIYEFQRLLEERE